MICKSSSVMHPSWPRISPVEPLIADGHLYLGMMWRSRKALDLLRDPRCTVHSTVSERNGTRASSRCTAAQSTPGSWDATALW